MKSMTIPSVFFALALALALLGLLVGVTADAQSERPLPPDIQLYGFPDPSGGGPAACHGQIGCGTMCFYITENATENEYELSCVPWIFTGE